MNLSMFTMLLTAILGQTVPELKYQEEKCHDFRAMDVLPDWLKVVGMATVKHEREGLRVTMLPGRPKTQSTGLALQLNLSGDFEITGHYELLSADRPTTGYGVGIGLSAAPNPNRPQWAMVGRFFRVTKSDKGVIGSESVHFAEWWDNEDPAKPPYRGSKRLTETAVGGVRLIRDGNTMRHMVAEGLDGEFIELMKTKFPAADLGMMRFMVNDGGNPPYAIDARLLDLRVRMGKVAPAATAIAQAKPAAVKTVPLTPASPAAPMAEKSQQGRTFWWLLSAAAAGLVAVAAVVLRRFIPSLASPAASGRHALVSECPKCGKRFRVPAQNAGKKIKCSACATVFVAEND